MLATSLLKKKEKKSTPYRHRNTRRLARCFLFFLTRGLKATNTGKRLPQDCSNGCISAAFSRINMPPTAVILKAMPVLPPFFLPRAQEKILQIKCWHCLNLAGTLGYVPSLVHCEQIEGLCCIAKNPDTPDQTWAVANKIWLLVDLPRVRLQHKTSLYLGKKKKKRIPSLSRNVTLDFKNSGLHLHFGIKTG